jgi:D-hydroxyproline dehydrogenase subunit gamma
MAAETANQQTDQITVTINGRTLEVPRGASVAAALMAAGEPCHRSVTGEPRSALCGMGVCMECRAIVDGVAHVRTCQLAAREGMAVLTQ